MQVIVYLVPETDQFITLSLIQKCRFRLLGGIRPFSGMPTTFLIGGRLFHYLFDRGCVFNFWMGVFLIRGGFSPPNLNHYVLIRRHYLFDRGVFLISGWGGFLIRGGFLIKGGGYALTMSYLLRCWLELESKLLNA